jgi:hypothetical protein
MAICKSLKAKYDPLLVMCYGSTYLQFNHWRRWPDDKGTLHNVRDAVKICTHRNNSESDNWRLAIKVMMELESKNL